MKKKKLYFATTYKNKIEDQKIWYSTGNIGKIGALQSWNGSRVAWANDLTVHYAAKYDIQV